MNGAVASGDGLFCTVRDTLSTGLRQPLCSEVVVQLLAPA